LLPTAAHAFPNACTVVKSRHFNSCFDFKVKSDICGSWPFPRPCARISYYVPYTFIETVSNTKETFFKGLPGALAQLATTKEMAPFGAEGDHNSYSLHSHITNVPLVNLAFAHLPCGGKPVENFCFTAMSEHLGKNWRTGLADKYQPRFLAWSAVPKACLIKGAVSSAYGSPSPPNGANSAKCSIDHSWIPTYPPSSKEVCNGWGITFPRYGTYNGADQTTASLMIASRLKSLGGEVFKSVPSFGGEKWQMIYPQSSSCFNEGQNIGVLRVKQVNELGRILNGKIKNYLYVIWRPVTCKVDWPYVPAIQAGNAIAQTTCRSL
jgi:hypothetical protein